ncbi:MAG: AAA family ATPase [Parvularcula sp.]|jgi:energy-coupling factor transporter ATP-binding protein EcfA2|nr:AAA family ATPase [Parvularcula sp.]
MNVLREWCADQDPWVSDALRRAAVSEDASPTDADAIAIRVQAAHGIVKAGRPDCIAFTDDCLVATVGEDDAPLLCSIGPLEGVDRLAEDQEMKFALDGLTIIYGENGSGKSGYARAARRLCTSRNPIALQGNVFTEQAQRSKVTFTVKEGEGEPTTHTWREGDDPLDVCGTMSFLDTADARSYVEGKTEILFLPAEVKCLTTLGQLYGLAAARCQTEADSLATAHRAPLGAQFSTASSVGRLIARLSLETPMTDLPSVAELRAAAKWDDEAATKLAELRVQLAEGPANQERTHRRLGHAGKLVADKAIAAIPVLGKPKLDSDTELLQALQAAREAAAVFAAAQVGRYPITATGTDTWRKLFALARQFAVEADVVPEDGAFAVGDPCMLCQRPLDEEARDRLNEFDTFIANETAAAVVAAQANIAKRIDQLRALNLDTADQALLALGEHRERDESLRQLVDRVSSALTALRLRRDEMIEYLQGGAVVEAMPDISSIMELSEVATKLIQRADELGQEGGVDDAVKLAEEELRDRETLSNCIESVIARRDDLADRRRYLACVDALGTRSISRLASSMRTELVTPELRERIEREIETLGIGHIPLRFTEQSASGRSFFEMALDSVNTAKKSKVLSEGEQRALAIACFFADAHVAASNGAVIVDDPVTSLDHQRIRKVAQRFASEAATGRQVIIFTHNLLFYQEVLRACADQEPQVKATPCLIQQSRDHFGLVSIDDQPWIAKKVKERVRALEEQVNAVPDDLMPESEGMRVLAKQFYTDLRETWERAVEEVVLAGVVERFGTDVKTQSLKRVDVEDNDYRIIHFAMKRASERSGHDQAAGKQIDPPDKEQMKKDLLELQGFMATHRKKAQAAQERREELEAPPAATLA